MFRVSKAEESSRTIFTIDGQLSGDSIEVVETFCDQAKSRGKPVHLFLRDVSMVDQAGRALLCRLAAKGVHLLATGIYTSYLVRMLSPSRTEPPHSSNDAAKPGGGREL
jgi:ABC-type transporter Mla MlaB component